MAIRHSSGCSTLMSISFFITIPLLQRGLPCESERRDSAPGEWLRRRRRPGASTPGSPPSKKLRTRCSSWSRLLRGGLGAFQFQADALERDAGGDQAVQSDERQHFL